MASGDAKTGPIEIISKVIPPWTGKGPKKTQDEAERCCLSVKTGLCKTEADVEYCTFQYYDSMRFETTNSTGICINGVKFANSYIPTVWTTLGVAYGTGGVSPDVAFFPTTLSGVNIGVSFQNICPEAINPSLTPPLYSWQLLRFDITQPGMFTQYWAGNQDVSAGWSALAFDPFFPGTFVMEKYPLCDGSLILPNKFKAVQVKIIDSVAVGTPVIGTCDLYVSW